MHRHWEDLLRIEKQQEKAGWGKRCSEFPWKIIFSKILCVVMPISGKTCKKSLLFKVWTINCYNIPICLCFSFSLSQAYVQQLESSRIKLNQLEQELQRARAQVRKKLFSTAKTWCILWIDYFWKTTFC